MESKLYRLEEKRTKLQMVAWIFLVIILFLAIYIPFFGTDLRYSFGNLFGYIYDMIGLACVYGGILFLAFGILGIFTRGKSWVKHLALGVLLLWIGAWITGIVFDLFGITIGREIPKGYHAILFYI